MKSYLFSLASFFAASVLFGCSGNDLSPDINSPEPISSNSLQQGQLLLQFDPFDDEVTNATRTLRNNNFGQLTFQDGDMVNVYNEELREYDFYTFKTDGFYYDVEKSGDDIPWVINPKYGIIRGSTTKDVKGYIHRSSRTYRIDVEIPRTFVYDISAETENIDGRGTRGYRCDLPMFGYAKTSTEGNYIEISNLRYLVAVLRININGFAGKARFLRLSNTAGKPLSGNLTAVLYTNPDNRKNTKLEVLDETLPVSSDIYVDLTNASSSSACIYLPVVAGLNGSSDGVRLEYSNDSSHNDPTQATGWISVDGVSFAGLSFSQHKRYTVDCDF